MIMQNVDNDTIYELSDFFKIIGNMTKSAVSHQLKALRSAKLVRTEKRGKNVFYALSDEHVRTVLEMALEHVSE